MIGGNLLVKAVWIGEVIAESDETIVIEGNHYFPPESVKVGYLTATATRSRCPWKGEAHYFTINVGEQENMDAAWQYPNPKPAAKEIKGYFAFWKDVKIID